MVDATPRRPADNWQRHGAAWLLAVGSMVAVMVATVRAPGEVAENTGFGILGGSYAYLVLAAADRAAVRWGRARTMRAPWRALVILALASALVAVTGLLLRKPFSGLIGIVGWALPIPTIALSGRLPGRRLGLLVAAVLGLVTLIIASAPLDGRPPAIELAEARPDDIVVLSWNLGSGSPFPMSSREDHLGAVASVILEVDADVACLQEVRGRAHLDLLLARLAERDSTAPGWRGAVAVDDRRVTAIVSRLDGRFDSVDDSLQFGGPTRLVLNDRRDIEIVSLHMRARRHSSSRRSYVDRLRRHVATTDHPVILVGDFNLDPDGFWDRASPVLSDDLDRDRGTLAALHALGRDAGAETAATAVFSRRIDRAFVPETIELVSYRVLYGRRLGRMDHRPIVIRIRRR